MLNFKQFFGWLYYIYYVGTPCSYSIPQICRGNKKAPHGVIMGNQAIAVEYTCGTNATRKTINYQQKFSVNFSLVICLQL